MATISLRVYVREIESLIDRNQTEAAIAHCMHILQYFPKHINTYRMLGKALHEVQRYTDAADVFQRVLSVVPDDFVSNVGLSIIRQDEGNLDSAIWHMERAYETQPSNQPIQEELRRLYGKRDGLEPPRVRLTRGALARMYMKGHLYTQAIAELRAALAEDPHRTDLQVLLAQAYFLTGQKVDSVEVCSQLLKKSPFCLEANRLLALILPNTERAKDSEIYRQRAISLDPYLQKADPATLVTDSIADAAVAIDKLDILSDQVSGDRAQPEWASTLGEPFHISEDNEPPEWFRDDPTSGVAQQSEADAQFNKPFRPSKITWETSTGDLGTDWLRQYEEATEQQEPTDSTAQPAIPDWMKAAGWEPSKGTEEEAPLSWEEFESQNSEQAEKGEVPDWLKAIAPDAQTEGASTWLQEKTPGASDTIVNWLNETQGKAPEEDISDLETVLDQAIAQKGIGEPDDLEEVPNWLQGLEKQGPSNGPTTGELHIPEWMKEAESPERESSELPDSGKEWLKEIETELPVEPQPQQEIEPDAKAAAFEIPDWLKPLEPEESKKLDEDITTMQTLVAPPPGNDLQHEFTEEKIEVEAVDLQAEAEVEIPEWVKRAMIAEQIERSGTDETLIEPPLAQEGTISETPVEELPDWLKSIVGEPESGWDTDEIRDETITAQPLEAEINLPEGTEAEDQISYAQPIEDEVTGIALVEEMELPSPDISAADTGLMDEDDALAYLASLAAKHEGEAGWLESVVEETMGEDASTMGSTDLDVSGQPEVVDEPIEPEPIGQVLETNPEDEIPDWLKSMVHEVEADQVKGTTSDDTILAAAPLTQDSAPIEPSTAAKILASTPEDVEATVIYKPAMEEQIKAASIGKTEPLEPDFAAAETGLMDEDEALAFLASLAAKHEGDDDWLKTVVEQTMGEDASVMEKQPIPLSGESEAFAWLDSIAENPKVKNGEIVPEEIEIEPESTETNSLERTEIIAKNEDQALIDQEEIPEWLKALGEEDSENIPPAFASDIGTIVKVDPNTASLSELEDIPGVGFIMAQNILDFRRTHGRIKHLEDLIHVPGITEADISGIRDFLEIPEEKVVPSLVTRPLVLPDTEVDQALYEARKNIEEQNYIEAANSYSSWIRKGQFLPEIIKDLQEFLAQNPQNVNLWQALGDACLRNDQLQEAFEAYAHAEELLR